MSRTLLFILLIPGLAAAHDPKPLTAPFVASPPAIDGDLADWAGVTFYKVTPATGVFDGESGTTDDPADLSFEFAVANDAKYLYVAMAITDDILVLDTNPDPNEKSARAWMDDCVEIFLDGDHSHSPHARDVAKIEFRTGGEFSVVANGAVTSDQSGVPGKNGDPDFWTSAGSYGPSPGAAYQAPWDGERKIYFIEARFNYQIMGVGAGNTIGFTVSAHDDDDGGDRDTALYWKGVGLHSWKDEAGWGDLQLSLPIPAVDKKTLGKIEKDSLNNGINK